MFEPFLASTLLVAIAEIGDKTQLLAVLLAARLRRPLAICFGILVATLANHALAALAGAMLADLVSSPWFAWAVAVSFLAMAVWALVPDRLDEDPAAINRAPRFGAFIATTVAFFFVEMGDKTQVATIALGARYQAVWAVTAGTTLGMMLANVPAVLLGERILRIVPLKLVRIGAAIVFALLGLWALIAAARIA